jgi:hypothetical protein
MLKVGRQRMHQDCWRAGIYCKAADQWQLIWLHCSSSSSSKGVVWALLLLLRQEQMTDWGPAQTCM